jgi:hypothetical protein
VRVIQLLRKVLSFVLRDLLLDTGALKKANPVTPSDLSAAVLASLSAISVFAEKSQELARNLLGGYGSFIPLLLVIFLILWSLYVIGAKISSEAFTVGFRNDKAGSPGFVYKHGQLVRWFSRMLLVALLYLIPRAAAPIVDELSTLPTVLYGYLQDAHTGKPLEGIIVRVVTAEGQDITNGHWKTDSDGFWIVKTSRPSDRHAKLAIWLPDCSVQELLPLNHESELAHKRAARKELGPIFSHSVSCQLGFRSVSP